MAVSMTISVKGIDNVIRTMGSIDENIDSQMDTFLTDVRNRMIGFIKKRAKHYTGNLASAITIEGGQEGTRRWLGLGNIGKLSRLAPYWAIINYGTKGKYKYKGTIGAYHFTPGYWRGNSFVYRPDLKGTGLRLPSGLWKAKIKAMNYIQDTISWANSVWKNYFATKVLIIKPIRAKALRFVIGGKVFYRASVKRVLR